jgi:hypothetical protein
MVSSRQRASVNSRSQEQDEERGDLSLQSRDVSFNELGPIGKTIAGCTEIVFTTIFDYCSGYLQGFLIGTLIGFSSLTNILLQFGVAVKVLRNGEQDVWSDICSSAAAGAFFARKGRFKLTTSTGRTYISVHSDRTTFSLSISLLDHKHSCSLFPSLDGPQAMLRGALLYGGLIYLTSGSRKNQIQEFTEKPASEF